MPETHKLAADTVSFETAQGQTFTLEPLEFLRELEDLHKATVGDGKDYYAYWQAISARMAELNPGVLLTMGEADNLAVEVGLIASKKKRTQDERIRSAQNSAYSMASPASTSPPSN